jgi:glycosyltransferase involved in cell wall biosynthesis
LLVGTFSSVRGTHRTYCEDLADRLEERGCAIVRTSDRDSRVQRLADMVQTTWTKRRHYGCAHVDVFSGAAFAWAEVVCFELRRLRKPYVLTLRGGNLPAFARRWPRRVRHLLRSTRMVTAPTPYLRDALADHAQIVVVPNAVAIPAYPFRRRAPARANLVWVRAFHEVYNPVLAVEVVAQLAAAHPAITLTMIGADKGDGSLQAVETRARELGVTDLVRLIPGIAKGDVPKYLAEADVFLNTTNVDNAPVSVVEAMACGLCVVTTSAGGIPQLVQHGEEALLVPPCDASAMSAAVARVLADSELAGRLSQRARERAAACDWNRVLDRWESIFDEVAADV